MIDVVCRGRMSDYRDDRPALRDRIRVLEQELERARTELEGLRERAAEAEELFRVNAKLTTDLEALRLRNKKKLAPERKQALFSLLGAVGIAGFGVFIYVASARKTPPSKPPRSTPKAAAAKGKAPRPKPSAKPVQATRSASCRCPKEGDTPDRTLTVTPNGEMSFGADRTHFAKFGFDVDGDVMSVAMSAGRETVPPSRVEGGELRMLMACAPDRVVFAQGQHITAWSWETGDVLWNTTLPEPVGSSKNGPLSAECTPMRDREGQPAGSDAGRRRGRRPRRRHAQEIGTQLRCRPIDDRPHATLEEVRPLHAIAQDARGELFSSRSLPKGRGDPNAALVGRRGPGQRRVEVAVTAPQEQRGAGREADVFDALRRASMHAEVRVTVLLYTRSEASFANRPSRP